MITVQPPIPIAGVVEAYALEDVLPALARIEGHAAQGGAALGFLSYEATPAFESCMPVHPAGGFPLLYFVLLPAFDPANPRQYWHDAEGVPRAALLRDSSPAGAAREDPYRLGDFTSTLTFEQYQQDIARIKEHIAAGDTYQVNHTFPLSAPFAGEAAAWFHALCARQGRGEFYYLDTGRFKVLCASPELFLSVEEGGRVTMQPMKGTQRRGRWLEEDRALGEILRHSQKDRAENVMIVDMIRNDLGRIAEPGSVRVDELFQVAPFPTVWQMTSTVSARSKEPLTKLLAATFPCASVTGAPKIETMKIIHALEQGPRRAYCGAVGWWGPGRTGRFSVGIRTAIVDEQQKTVWYHVGSGITWDSTPEAEYAECLQKAAILQTAPPEFELLETLLFENGGYFLLERHLERMQKSALYFDFPCDADLIKSHLRDLAIQLDLSPDAVSGARSRVRLLLSRDGKIRSEHFPLVAVPMPVWHVTVAANPIPTDSAFLFHKTTHRKVHEVARAAFPGHDDVILWNEQGEVTESTMANVVLEDSGGFWTPPRECGLLAGTFREQLLAEGRLRERKILREELRNGRVHLINAVRKWITIDLDA